MKKTAATAPGARSGARRDLLAVLALAALCLVVYGRCVTFDYTLYDDPNIIFENPNVRAGLTWDSIRWAILNPNFGLYMPLPTLTFMLDRNLFGDWAGGYHGMTLLWHILCVCSFYWVMRRLTGNFAAVFAASVLVAVHPVQTMTVNWISARNEIMPAFFMLWSVDLYRRWRCRGAANGEPDAAPSGAASAAGRSFFRVPHYTLLLSLLFMFLGIMSKQGIVALPAVLLLLDYWPLHRIDLSFARPLTTMRRMVVLTLEKAPWFALSGLGAIFAVYGKRDFGMHQDAPLLPPMENIRFAFTAYGRYLFHILYPERYQMAYSVSPSGPQWWMIAASALALFGITAFTVAQLWKRPWLIVFWGWFVLFLLPVSGLVRYAYESIALRYLYAPGMGLYLLAGFGLYEASRHVRPVATGRTAVPLPGRGHAVFWALLLLLTAAYSAQSYRQSGFWRNSETLAERALAVSGGTNAMAHNHLSFIRMRQGLRQQAHAHIRRTIELEPHRNTWNVNYVVMLNQQQRYEESLAILDPLLERQPDHLLLNSLYGGALTGLMRFEEAIPYLMQALDVEPRHVPSLYNLGLCMQHLGRIEEARTYYERALAVQPTHRMAQAALAQLRAADRDAVAGS